MPRKETGPVAIQTFMHGLSICSITNANTRFAMFNKHQGRTCNH